MLLTPEKSKCERNQAIVVSQDKGTRREHRATNPQRKFDLRHYKPGWRSVFTDNML